MDFPRVGYDGSRGLQVYLHVANQELIDRVVRAIKVLLPERPVAIVRHGRAAVAVSAYFIGWPWLFPQHGYGRKHMRRIVLERWQEDVVSWYPDEFVRGCIESDGCRHRRVVNGKNYPASSFCNRSEDISVSSPQRATLLGFVGVVRTR